MEVTVLAWEGRLPLMDGLSLQTSVRVSDDCMIRELDAEAVILNLVSRQSTGSLGLVEYSP